MYGVKKKIGKPGKTGIIKVKKKKGKEKKSKMYTERKKKILLNHNFPFINFSYT